MTAIDVIPDVGRLSEAKRKLLERYRNGELAREEGRSRAIKKRSKDEPAPLSLTQEQLWYREQTDGIPPLYNEAVTVRRSGSLDLGALERSLNEIVRRHEIWRTTYDSNNGLPVQLIHPPSDRFPLHLADLRKFSGVKLEEEILRITTAETQRRFDLGRGPLLRATLLRTGETNYQLFMVAHLSIIDGISVYQVFPSELAALYGAFSSGKPSPLPDPPIQYADYAYWQRRISHPEERAEQLTYWRKQLAGELPVLRWPTKGSRPAVRTYRGAIQPFTLSRTLTDALKDLSRRSGVTLFTVLMASFRALLYCYTGQADIVIGMPSPAGRKRPEVQNLLGYFLNPVPLRINLEGDPSFCELLPRVQTVIAKALCHDDLPFETLVKALQPTPDPSRNPFFTVAISLQPKTPDEANGWQVTSMDADSGGAIWDLYLAFIDGTDGMLGRVQYNPDLFTSVAIMQMLNDLMLVMSAVVVDPARRVSELPNGL